MFNYIFKHKGPFKNYVTAEGGGVRKVLRASRTELKGPLESVTGGGGGVILSKKSVT